MHHEEQDRKIEELLPTIQDEPTQIDEIAKVRGWFRPQQDSTFYPIIQHFLSGQKEISETINKITAPIDEVITAGKSADVNWLDLWYSFIHSAKRISFRDSDSHAKLIDLYKAFRAHADSSEAKSKYATTLNYIAAREAYNDAPGVGAGWFEAEAHAWANLNYFYARLTADGLDNMWTYVIYSMREALEEAKEDDDPKEFVRRGPVTAAQKYDASVPAAAVWVFALGKKLYENVEDLTPKDKKYGNPAKPGELWEGGKPEFSKARWAFWKKRFGEIANVEGVKQETRAVAKEAVGAMEKAEE